jgi:hypothetical protein
MSAIPKTGTVNHPRHAHAWAPAALACMGIVFGDIGTSPLYALSVAVKAASPDGQISPHAVLGVVSLIFWSLIGRAKMPPSPWLSARMIRIVYLMEMTTPSKAGGARSWL